MAVQNEAQIKKEAEKKEAEAKEKAKARLKTGVTFIRKDVRAGIYSTRAFGKKIQIRDRQSYFTKKDSEIKFFDNDSEIVELETSSKPKKNK